MSNPSNNLTLQDFVRSLFRQKRKVLSFFCLTMLLVTVGVILWPRTYASEMKLYARTGRESVGLDPTATTGQTIQIRKSDEAEINAVMEILESQLIAERVVDSLGIKTIQGKSEDVQNHSTADSVRKFVTAPLRWAKRTAASVIGLNSVSEREQAILSVDKMVGCNSAPFSNVFTITCNANSPALAKKILVAYTDVFMEEYLRLSRTKGSYEFFSKQSALQHEQLQTATRALRDAKNFYGVLTIDGKRSMLQNQIDQIGSQKLEIQSKLASSTAKAADLQSSVDSLSENVVTQTVDGVGGMAADGMRQRLYELEIRERELLSKYTPAHPFVTAIQEQRMEVEQILASEPTDRPQTTTALNPTYQDLKMQLLAEKANVTANESTLQLLAQQHEQRMRELKELNQTETLIADLQRKVDLLESNYKAYSENVEQARIDRALKDQRISSINIVQPATYSDRPVSPATRVALLLGIVFATVGALGAGLLAERWDDSLVSAIETEEAFGVPVLVSIPEIPQPTLNV